MTNSTDTDVGARRSLDAAYRHYQSRLFHAALRITRNEDDAWDAVQEGMVNALRHAERFRGDAAVASWLYSIVVNAALYQGRRASAASRRHHAFHQRVWPDAELSHEAGTRHSDPESYVHARIDLARAAGLIEVLPEERQRLLTDAVGGDSNLELAAAWGMPVSAIKSRLSRARGALRAKFEAAGSAHPTRSRTRGQP